MSDSRPTHEVKCHKCMATFLGSREDAGRQCVCGGTLFLMEKVRTDHQADAMAYPVVDTRPTYKIPARDLVAGMCGVGSGPHDARAVAGIREYWRGHPDGLAGNMWVMLPGPSPREMACTCKPGMGRGPGSARDAMCGAFDKAPGLETVAADMLRPWRCAPPGEHLGDCPVAPVSGKHGGMRLWPAPFKGNSWRWSAGTHQWCCDGFPSGPVRPGFLHNLDVLFSAGGADALLQCFFSPPEPQPERHEPTPWAPHAGYEGLAVRYG